MTFSPAIDAIINDETMTPHQKRREAMRLGFDWKAEAKKAEDEMAELLKQRTHLEAGCQSLDSLVTWGKQPLKLERNDCSRLHKLVEAVRAEKVHGLSGKRPTEEALALFPAQPNIIVVEHDWAAAFGDEIKGGDLQVRLPYPCTVFEFRISGRTVIVLAMQPEDGVLGGIPFFEGEHGFWYAPFEEANKNPGLLFAFDQVRAISISLDAEVAASTPIRAPHSLNVKRAKQGKVPLYEYRVVRLNRKPRTQALPAVAQHAQKRLHFRRGHWRHYEGFKTWVRWCLVGSPDLGFIDKEYRI